ncbi:hypothetical protein ABH312_13770, partial [Chromobacterium piscinae]
LALAQVLDLGVVDAVMPVAVGVDGDRTQIGGVTAPWSLPEITAASLTPVTTTVMSWDVPS